MSPSKPTVDLTNCDKEPIHLLGRIQSHGFLLAFDKKSQLLTYASENAEGLFKSMSLSSNFSLKHILDEEARAYINQLLKEDFSNRLYPKPTIIDDKTYLCYISDAKKDIIIEFESYVYNPNEEVSLISDFNRISQNIKSCKAMDTLDTTVVHNIQRFTGFDRVMMYRFDDNGHGQVVAEEKVIGLESYLGLKYPASDIPTQARSLYLTNLSRSIADVSDEGKAIQCYKKQSEALDLSYSVYRSVSSIHIEYLKNMGVSATHALSVVIDNSLWGMIILHHYKGPKYLNFHKRACLQSITTNLASSIELLEFKQKRDEEKKQERLLQLIKHSKSKLNLKDIISSNWPAISNHLKVQGYTILENDKIQFSEGETPHKNEVFLLHDMLKKVSKKVPSMNQLYFSDQINSKIKKWKNKNIKGFLQLALVPELGKYLYVWRIAENKIINWAGNPDKAINIKTINGKEQLTPRTSFELWQEEVKDKSQIWKEEELLFSKKLVSVIVSREINDLNTVIASNKELANNEKVLNSLIERKSRELYELNIKLQKELEENKAYQQELEFSKKASEGLNKLKTNIIGNVSHETRTPLNGIIGLASVILQDPEASEDIKSVGQMIHDSGERLLNTINRILKVARMEKDQIDVVFENIELVSLTKSILKPLEILASQREQQMVFNHHKEAIDVVTDQHYYQQILTNLVSNAINYTHKGGYIEINLKIIHKNDRDFVCLSVEDNGIGIAEEAIDKIFDPFYTENDVTNQNDNSSGLGLYLVKTNARYIGGTLEVQSEKYKGSIFQVKFEID